MALTKLADIYEAAGNNERVEQLLEELVDRNRDDEGLAARLRSGANPQRQTTQGRNASAEAPTPADTVSERAPETQQEAPSAVPSVPEEALDPETRHYVAQALTDVDLFSSYGLTQKAANLLESVLQRAPRHTPTLERLLDLSVGAGNDRRTAQLAATLEQIHRERDDNANAERFAEIQQEISGRCGCDRAKQRKKRSLPRMPIRFLPYPQPQTWNRLR